jgi:GT2 family glycosyltransferase
MLLNPDARLLDDQCTLLLEYMDRHPRVGIVGPRIIGTTGRLEDSCREFMSPGRFLQRTFRRLVRGVEGPLLETRNIVQPQVVDWVSGACMVVRKEAIERVGPMDELYFLYVEDMDWCKRFWDAGLSVIYWPDMTVEHRGGRLSTKNPSMWFLNRYAWIHLRSYLQFLLKHYLPILRR